MTINDEMPCIRGAIHYKVYKAGVLIEEVHDHNLVVAGGRRRMANLLGGLRTNYVGYIGVGTGSKDPVSGDSKLTNMQLFPIDNAERNDFTLIFTWHLDATQANGLDIREFGLFTNEEKVSDRTMVTRQVRASVLGKADDIVVEGTYTLTF